jgi:hypothetical protein
MILANSLIGMALPEAGNNLFASMVVFACVYAPM